MFPTLFEIGSFRLGTYGVMMAIGALVSIKLASRESARAGMNKDQFYNFAVFCLLGSIAGARVLYLIVEWDEFVRAPLGMLFAREGFVFLGGFLTGILVGWWYIRRLGLSFLKAADCISPYIALGHAFGRIGCFLNGCCHGEMTTSWWGVPIEGYPGRYVPIQLVESLFLFLLFGFLYGIRNRIFKSGALFLVYLTSYSAGRFILEFFRGDERGSLFGVFSTSQEISLTMFLVSLLCLIALKLEPKKK